MGTRSRREVVRLLSGLLCGSLLVKPDRASAQWPPTSTRPEHRRPPREERPGGGWGSFLGGGCTFAGFDEGEQRPPQITPWSPYPLINAAYQREGMQLLGFFGVQPAAGFLDDTGSPNAFATPQAMFTNGPHGTILFGLQLTGMELQRDNGVGMSLPAIMAHEFAHIRQFHDGRLTEYETSIRELHADFLAGWYMQKRRMLMPTDITPALRAFFERGDYEFNSEQHHGTPEQRLAAVSAGVSSGASSIEEAFDDGLVHVDPNTESRDDSHSTLIGPLLHRNSLLLGAVGCCTAALALRGRRLAAARRTEGLSGDPLEWGARRPHAELGPAL